VLKSSIFLLSAWQARHLSSLLPLFAIELKAHFILVLGLLSFLTEEGGQGLIFTWVTVFGSTFTPLACLQNLAGCELFLCLDWELVIFHSVSGCFGACRMASNLKNLFLHLLVPILYVSMLKAKSSVTLKLLIRKQLVVAYLWVSSFEI
jgi:hypothetical protein